MTQLQIPQPWKPNAELAAYRNTIEQAVAGEAAGFHYYWLTEMHFFKQIGHSPCPDLLHAAISQRTSRIRLGFAVMLLTTHNPYMLAERIATADVLSNGRIDFGFGRGSTSYMTEAFGVKKEESLSLANEALEAVMQMFEGEHFSGYKGKHFDLPPRHVLPRPIQTPHPPLWIAASNLSTYEYAAKQGAGIIGVTRNSIDETRSAIHMYRETIRSADPKGFIGKASNENVAAFALACCHEDDRIGKDVACAAARWYNGDNDAELNHVRFATAGGKEAVVAKFSARSNDQLLADGMAIGGNPDSICRQVEQWAEAGLDQLIFVLQAGNTTHDQVLKSIDLIGEKVIPRFEVKAHAAA
ncbi:LLM class flavin-dependent oxidoreductase [Reyranella soli]|uniref:Flavin-dependent oxidoreductase n=1 Tax=Reyranella soli TaxID=1230389 RepID=A0A512N2X7_9HYPH|nr:LLM class flavin-dependent oxidoreductase [Reyranella soli]GEP53340.1 flavin-dependent oxidoreductase [Reyranella soli]